MPREQRTNLKKTAVTKTELGIYSSKPSGTVDMPIVQPKKTKGQALAEGLSIAMAGAAIIGQEKADEKNKRNAVLQRYLGMAEAGSEAARIFDDLDDRGVTQDTYAAELAKSLRSSMETLKGKSQVNISYLEGFSSVLGRELGAKQDKVFESLMNNKKAKEYEVIRQGIKVDLFTNGMDPLTAYRNMQTALNVGNKEAGAFYVTNVIALIDNMADADVNFDGQGASDKFLKITPEKGVVFADHPVYGKEIRSLDARLLAGKGTALKQQQLLAKKITKDVTSKAMSLILKVGAGPGELLEAEALVKANSKYMSGRELGTFVKLMRDLKQNGFAATSDPAVLFKAKQAATAGNLEYDDILKLHTELTSEDISSVYQAKIDRDKNSESKRGSIFNTNVSKLISGANSVLNVMSGPDKFLDPVSGANRVQFFGDEFMMAVENYRSEHDTLIIPYTDLLKMRDEAQKNAQIAFPMDAMMKNNPVENKIGSITVNDRGDKVSSTVLPGTGTASNPTVPTENISIFDSFMELFDE